MIADRIYGNVPPPPHRGAFARIPRECRKHPDEQQPVRGRIRKPLEILFPDEDEDKLRQPRRGYARDIVKDNIRDTQLMQPRRSLTREVPPFSTQTLQRGTRAASLPRASSGTMRPRAATASSIVALQHERSEDCLRFRLLYDRNDLPLRLIHGAAGERPKAIRWLIDPSALNAEQLQALFPVFASGLPIMDQPYRFVAERGMNDLLDVHFHPAVIINVLPSIVRGLRAALYSLNAEKKRDALSILSRLARAGAVGPALVPYYRQLLPPLRAFAFGGVQLDIAFSRGRPLLEVIESTLNELERTGGPNAFINIKYVIPTYESCTGAH